MILRPLRDTPDDTEAVREISRAAFSALTPGSTRVPTEAEDVFQRARAGHLATSDPQGCWLAFQGDRPIGFALSARRDSMWLLALTAVLPEYQGRGVGRLLLEQALEHGRGCLRGMITVSVDPGAARRYRLAGFTLHPTMRLSGQVDRSALRDVGELPVHRGNRTHLYLLDSIDRRLRDAAHGVDHELMLRHYDELLVVDTATGTGYCYRDGGTVKLLAATTRHIAARLLREALAAVPEDREAKVEWLTAEQEWAVDVGLEVGLTVENRGYLALRGMRPPAPYLPSGGFL
jgi:GNAT superfamily N-acetyltransferase